MVSERFFYPRLVRMSKRGRSETGMSTSILMLTSTNYLLWAIRMEVSLEAHDL